MRRPYRSGKIHLIVDWLETGIVYMRSQRSLSTRSQGSSRPYMKNRRRSQAKLPTPTTESLSILQMEEPSSSSLDINESLLRSSSDSDSSRLTEYNSSDSDSTHRLTRPPISYATLITEAIGSCPEKKLILSDIYEFVEDHYPYFKTAGQGWKVRYFSFTNSI
jgi:hypothetical protein